MTATSLDLSQIKTDALSAASTFRSLIGLGSSAILNAGSANGVATLDANAKLTSAQIPDISLISYLGSVASQAAMLALSGQQGDWCVRSDLSTTWVITGSDPTLLANWTQLSYPSVPVQSVFGRTGAVVGVSTDYSAVGITNTAIGASNPSTGAFTTLSADTGTITDVILGSGGPKLKNSSGTVLIRNNTDNANAPIVTSHVSAGTDPLYVGSRTSTNGHLKVSTTGYAAIVSAEYGNATGGAYLSFATSPQCSVNKETNLGSSGSSFGRNGLCFGWSQNASISYRNDYPVDYLPGIFEITGNDAYSAATINKNGGAIRIYGGAGATSGVPGNTILAHTGTTGRGRVLVGTATDDGVNLLQVAGSGTFSGGTVTTSTPVLNLTQTFNNAAVTFSALKLDVTDTASNASSLLMDLQVGGTSKFNVGKTGIITGYSHIYPVSANAGDIGTSGREWGHIYLKYDCVVDRDLVLRQNSGRVVFRNGGTILASDTSNTIDQRNSTSAQTYRLYNTYSSATSYERGKLEWSSSVFRIGTEKGSGGGAATPIEFQTDGTTRLTISSTGLFTIADALNLAVGTTTGTKIGTGTTQKLGFWNATPVVQPDTTVAAATTVAGSGTAVTEDSTFDGYTLAKIVKALRNTGILA